MNWLTNLLKIDIFYHFLVAPAGLPAAHSFALNQNSFGPQTKMLSIGKVVDELDKKGKKPGSPNYATAVKNEILFHFEIDGKDLDDSTKLENKAKNIAKKCKDLFTSAQTIKKMFDVDKNKVRLFDYSIAVVIVVVVVIDVVIVVGI